MLTPRKNTLYWKNFPQRRIKPTMLHQAGQRAQLTTKPAIPAPRTASPTHYQPAIPAPIKQDSQPNTLPTSYSGPHQAGQPAQHTTKQLFRPPSSRTASPTHYQPAIPAPIKQDSQPNTLPTSYSGPHQAGQPAQHTTNQLFRPPSSRTASPTHYQPAIPAPIKQCMCKCVGVFACKCIIIM